MIFWRVVIPGVWPDLTPSGNPKHAFCTFHATEPEAREFFESYPGEAKLLWVDSDLGEMGQVLISRKHPPD